MHQRLKDCLVSSTSRSWRRIAAAQQLSKVIVLNFSATMLIASCSTPNLATGSTSVAAKGPTPTPLKEQGISLKIDGKSVDVVKNYKAGIAQNMGGKGYVIFQEDDDEIGQRPNSTFVYSLNITFNAKEKLGSTFSSSSISSFYLTINLADGRSNFRWVSSEIPAKNGSFGLFSDKAPNPFSGYIKADLKPLDPNTTGKYSNPISAEVVFNLPPKGL